MCYNLIVRYEFMNQNEGAFLSLWSHHIHLYIYYIFTHWRILS